MNAITEISREELIARLAAKSPPLLLDVLPAEECKASHLPGAQNACVFDMSFLEDVKKLVPDAATPLVVYGSSVRNLASTTAAQKLAAAGYTQVADYRGGLEDWRASGQAVEADAEAVSQESKPRDGTHRIDLEKSKVEWTGRNLTGGHSGTIKLRDGSIEIEGGRPVRGSFALDMRSIECADIALASMRKMLIQHLESDDFFDVARFPETLFQLRKITGLPNRPPGSPNCEITGELTIKDVTHKITFQAILALTQDGLLAADAHFDIDRTRWGVLYGSGKFYEKLGKHLVNDEISLGLKILTLPLAEPAGKETLR